MARASVSKTEGRGFESLRPCHAFKSESMFQAEVLKLVDKQR